MSNDKPAPADGITAAEHLRTLHEALTDLKFKRLLAELAAEKT